MISVCLTLLGQAASAFPRRAFDIPLARTMESSLVLRAASCWNAWGEAMNILKIKGLEEETAKRFLEQAYWDLSRIPDADYRRITSQISREGLRGGGEDEGLHNNTAALQVPSTSTRGVSPKGCRQNYPLARRGALGLVRSASYVASLLCINRLMCFPDSSPKTVNHACSLELVRQMQD